MGKPRWKKVWASPGKKKGSAEGRCCSVERKTTKQRKEKKAGDLM